MNRVFPPSVPKDTLQVYGEAKEKMSGKEKQ